MSIRQTVKLTAAFLPALLALAGCSEGAKPAAAAVPGSERIVRAERPIADHYLVRLAGGPAVDAAAAAAELAGRHGGTVLRVYEHAMRGFSVRASAAAAAALTLDPRVERVEEDAVAEAADVAAQVAPVWSLDRVDQHAAAPDDRYFWDDRWAGQGVDAFVLDTGVLLSHVQVRFRASFAFDALGEGATGDCSGHGTHVAGTLGGSTYGVAKGVSLRSVRVLDCSGNGKVSDVVAGLDWVIANHTHPAVANLSLFSGPSPALDDAVEAAVAHGIPVVVAAGDGGKDACNVSPARTPGAIAVAAAQQEPPAAAGEPPRDVLAPYSNVGDCVALVAPGSGVVSAWNTSVVADLPLSGTSMAAPHVAGAVALLLSRYPSATPEEIARTLVAGSTRAPVGAPAFTPDRLLFTRSVEANRLVDGEPPSASITAPAAGAALSGAATVGADATDDVGVTRVELFVDGRWRGSDDAAPWEIPWDTSTALDGAHALVVRAYDAAGKATDSAAVPVSVSNPGVAHLDAALGVARCETLAASCDSRDLVRGRDGLGPERYAPSVLPDPCDADPAGCVCRDGPTGAYLVDESVERVVVAAADGAPLATGGNVRVDVDVFVGVEMGDFIDLYASPAVSPPVWRHLITLEPVASGPQTLTASYTLPAGVTQAVRAGLRHGGAAGICTEGGYDERDDLVFEVGPGTEDTVPPTVEILAPASGAVLAGTSDIEVDAHDDRLVTKVVLSAEDAATGKVYPVAQLTAPPYLHGWRSALLPNGEYKLRAVAQDGAGRVAVDEVPVTLADLAGPVCAISAPASGEVFPSNLVAVTASAEDEGAVDKLDVLVDGLPYATDRHAPWGFEFRLPANGDYVLALRGTDLQGNVAVSAPVTVSVSDHTPPALRVLSPADQALVSGEVTFAVEPTDASGIARVDLYLDGLLLGSATGAPFEVTWDAARVPNGTYVFSATAHDGVGNSASASVAVRRNDVVPPTVSLTKPLPDAVLSGNVLLAANASDDIAVERVEFWLTDPVLLTETLVGADTTSPYEVTWASGSVAAGDWEITSRAYDYAGLSATSDPPVPVKTGDFTPPATAVVAPEDGLRMVTGAIRVAAEASDPGGRVVRVELRVDDVPFATFTAPPFEALLDTTTVANGARELTSKAWDLAGNTAVSAPVSVSVANPGAVLDPVLGAPACDEPRPLCHTGLLVVGRGPLGPEQNAPNTVDGCPDGLQGEYGVDESIEHVAIASLDGGLLAGGKPARIDVRAVIADPAYDRIDVYAAADPAAPAFVLLATLEPAAAGEQTLTATVPLLGTTRQVIRVALRGGGPAEVCGTTGYDDRDDVVIAVLPAFPDTTPPAVSITSPAAGTAVSAPIAVTAGATDDVGVTRVEFRASGVAFAEDLTPPYEATWDPAALPPGTYPLTAVAFDLAGNSAESAAVPVVVQDVILPTCRITAPVADETVSGTVTVQVAASDDVGVARVDLFRTNPDGSETLVGTDSSAPYAFSLATASLEDAETYLLVARARDAGNNVGASDPIAIHVARSGLAAWDRTLKAPKCATAGVQCWTGALVVGRGPLGPEPKAPNTLKSSCADGAAGYFHLDESADAIAVRAADPAVGLKEGAAVRIEVKVWATASFVTDRLDVLAAPDARSPVWTLLGTLTPVRAGAQVLAFDHVLGVGSLQAVRAQFRHAGSPAGGCSPGDLDDRDDLAFAVSR